jgi:hypothetical protein
MAKAKYCAPGRGSDSITCFTLESLVNIANHWNVKNPNDIIQLSKTKKILWKRIKEKMRSVSNCPDEWCWVDSDMLKDIKDPEILEHTFRPKMPFPWKKDIKQWLNTLDIANVLEQYPLHFKEFEFIGPVPLDFGKQLSPGQCIVNELCNINFENLYKKGKTKLGIVFNMDPHNKQGSHWIAMFMDFTKAGIYFFDSYGYKPPKEIGVLLAELRNQGNAFLYKHKLLALKDVDNVHATVCRVQYDSPNTAKFSCIQFVKGLYVGDIVGSCNLGRINLNGKITKGIMNRVCDSIKEIRIITAIDTRRKIVTFDKPLTVASKGCDGMVHKCFKIYINKNRHQYKYSECGTYSIYFITQLLYGVPFHQIGGGKIILDDQMNNNRTYFYRPNHDQVDKNPWLSELFTS